MRGILVDVNIQGQMELVGHVLRSPEWSEVWSSLRLPLLTFADIGLANNTKDLEIWRHCQARQWVLVTANRNYEGPDSLEEAIRTLNTPECLPIFTLADPDELLRSRSYRERVAVRLLEYLLEIDRFLGTGRIYLP
jgi:hypothetical protein